MNNISENYDGVSVSLFPLYCVSFKYVLYIITLDLTNRASYDRHNRGRLCAYFTR
jgi:hypothetical protein